MNVEEQITALRMNGDLRGAGAKAVEAYGREIFGFLMMFLRDELDAAEAFSETCEDLWVGLPQFEGRCSMRTWLYTLARHAAIRLRRGAHRRVERNRPLSEIGHLAERVRSETMPHLRTTVKDEFEAIRETLGEDERTLLVLRVDRALSWREIAHVFSPADTSVETLTRVEARLRQRFQKVKEDLGKRVRAAGLIRERD